MERKIKWQSGCYDEIEAVYERAEKSGGIAEILSELERMALWELEQNCAFLKVSGRSLTVDDIRNMSADNKEKLMFFLADTGLEEFDASVKEPIITVTLSPAIKSVLGCTMFSILNRIEKLDGAYNTVLFPKATVELSVPLGEKTGLFVCEMLITSLYPWLSVTEKTRDVIAEESVSEKTEESADNEPLTESNAEAAGSEESEPVLEDVTPSREKKPLSKSSLFKKIFGKL